VTGAVGIGIWAMLILSRAARLSLADSRPAHARGTRTAVTEGPENRQADLWLTAAIGLFVVAIGYGLSSAAGSRGPGIAAGLLEAAGIAALAWSVDAAQSRGLLRSRPVSCVLVGLSLLTLSFLAAAIVAGLGFGTLKALGAGLAVITAIELAGVAALGLEAWTQVRELSRQRPAGQVQDRP
jgi:hypothetical protein